MEHISDITVSNQSNSVDEENHSSESNDKSDVVSIIQNSSSDSASNTATKTYTEQEWREHPEDFKLIAFTL